MSQGELFGAGDYAPRYIPRPERVRNRLNALLADLRAAEQMPWTKSKLELQVKVFPQMTNWLPEEEGHEFRKAFAAEIARLS